MNAKNLIAAVAMIAATGSVFAADNAEFVEFTKVQPVKTRAEVRAELEQTYAQGALGRSEYVEFTHIASTKSRDEVRKEAVQAAGNSKAGNIYFGG